MAVSKDSESAQAGLGVFKAIDECGPTIKENMALYDQVMAPLEAALLSNTMDGTPLTGEPIYDDMSSEQKANYELMMDLFYPGFSTAGPLSSVGDLSSRNYSSSTPGYLTGDELETISKLLNRENTTEEETEAALAAAIMGTSRNAKAAGSGNNGSVKKLLEQIESNLVLNWEERSHVRDKMYHAKTNNLLDYDGSKEFTIGNNTKGLTKGDGPSLTPAQQAYVDFVRADYLKNNTSGFGSTGAKDAKKAFDEMKKCEKSITDADQRLKDSKLDNRALALLGLQEGASLYAQAVALAGQMGLGGLSDENDEQIRDAYNDVSETATQLALTAMGVDMNYKEQCYLLAKILQLSQYKMSIIDQGLDRGSPAKKTLPYVKGAGNSSIQAMGDPYGFVNKLTQSGRFEEFFNIEGRDLSSMQPYIRLYKMTRKKFNGTMGDIETPIQFDSVQKPGDLKEFFKKKEARGFGVGIKDFTFKYEGSNPFSVKKSISAKLTIHANSFDELIQPRTSTNPGSSNSSKYRYLDLCLKTGNITKKKEQAYDDYVGKAIQRIQDSKNYSLDFRLKAVVGWSTPSSHGDNSTATATKRRKMLDAVDDSYITLNLTPTTHEFNIGDDGRVEFVINYLAYVDELFDQPNYNIFSTGALNAAAFLAEVEKKDALVKCDEKKGATAKQSKDGALSTWIEGQKASSLQNIIHSLSDKGRIFYARIPRTDLALFTSQGPFYERAGATLDVAASESLRKSMKKEVNEMIRPLDAAWVETKDKDGNPAGVDSEGLSFKEWDLQNKRNLQFSSSAYSWDEEHIAFFFLSDLIDTILKSIEGALSDFSTELTKMQHPNSNFPNPKVAVTKAEEKLEIERFERLSEQFEKFRVVLGPIEIVDPKSELHTQFLSMGDLPISVKYFVEWLSSEVVGKATSNYPLTTFLSRLMNNLLRDFINTDSCWAKRGFQKLRLFNTTITDYELEGTGLDSLTNRALRGGHRLVVGDLTNSEQGHKRLLNISGPKKGTIGPPNSERNYLIFHAGRTQPVQKMNGDRAEDHGRGIFHYILGRDKGIIKNIALTRTSTAGHKEVRFEGEGYNGLAQLREVYDVEIESFANISAWPGTYIFVDPRGFAPTLSYDMKQEGFNFEDLTDYGLGGYYMIISSEHSFGPGYANTSITAKWTHQIDHKGDQPASGQELHEAGYQAGDQSTIPNLQSGKCASVKSGRRDRLEAAELGVVDNDGNDFITSLLKSVPFFGDDVSKKPGPK